MNLKSRPDRLIAQLQEAIALHNQGQLDAADIIYRKVLQQSPRHPDAMHLRALVCHAKGKFLEAANLAEAAISVAPRVANLHNTAGEAWRRQNQFDKARQRLTAAIRLDPAMAMAHHNLSLVCSAELRHSEARELNERARRLNPAHLEAIIQGVEIACVLGDGIQAEQLAQRLGDFSGDVRAMHATARYHVHRARQLLNQLQFSEADQAAQDAIASQPDFWGGWALRGEVHFEQLKFAQAELFCTLAANLAPENEDARLNLTVVLKDQQRVGEAASHLRHWLTDHPDSARARFSMAGISLLQGNYAQGWADYEARWRLPSPSQKFAAASQWEGQAVNRLLLYAEQGLGDSVQMLRFIPEAVALCEGAVVLQVQPALLRLARRVFATTGVTVVSEMPATAFDAACPLMSLPRVLGVDSDERVLGHAPYLWADPQRTAQFAARLSGEPGKKLGLVWRGSEESRANRLRTLPEEALIALLELSGWTPVSLQFAVKAPAIASRPLLDLSAEIADFEDLAAAMMALDAVVSLDSGPAHLAGALGVRTCTLLPWLHDWRWGLASERCVWYRSMTLFRQPVGGDWQATIGQLVQQLGGATKTVDGEEARGTKALADMSRAIVGNEFPFVRAVCRHGTFTLPLFDHYITRSMLAYGEYSPREAEMLTSYLRSGDTVIDVGANLGTLTLAFARAVGPSGRVIAFEPQSMIHGCLMQTLADSAVDWVDARRQAAGAGVSPVRIGQGDPARAQNFGAIGLVNGYHGEEVEMIRLDDLALGECRLLKIDVEGHELAVLQGALRLLAQQRPVVCVECDRPALSGPLVAFLREQGYRVFRHEPPLFSPRNDRHCGANLFLGLVSGNLLALPPGEHPPPEAVPV